MQNQYECGFEENRHLTVSRYKKGTLKVSAQLLWGIWRNNWEKDQASEKSKRSIAGLLRSAVSDP